jgi:hypothetical protein
MREVGIQGKGRRERGTGNYIGERGQRMRRMRKGGGKGRVERGQKEMGGKSIRKRRGGEKRWMKERGRIGEGRDQNN